MKKTRIIACLLTFLASCATWAIDIESAMEKYEQKKYQEAIKDLRSLANSGNVRAQDVLGWIYTYGQGDKINHIEALKWTITAAEGGNHDAQMRLGFLYFWGGGILKQDYVEARRWLLKSAPKEHPLAQNMLGEIYRDGKGVAIDDVEAIKWFRKASEQTAIIDEAKKAWLRFTQEKRRSYAKRKMTNNSLQEKIL